MTEASYKAPNSIVVVGSGVFGLSTVYALCKRTAFRNTKIILVDRNPFPTPDGASVDTSRMVRSDYADPDYAELMREGQKLWRGEWGAENRYNESGLLLTAEGTLTPYLQKSLEVVRRLEGNTKTKEKPTIEPFTDRRGLIEAANTGGANGTSGYINRKSGWADAESTMRWLRFRVTALNHVEFSSVGVEHLVFDHEEKKCTGVALYDGSVLSADLIVVAAGAWSPTLVDLRGRVSTTSHFLVYIELSREESEILSETPAQMSSSNGVFAIPPPHPDRLPQPAGLHSSGPLYLKLSRHDWGYSNPTEIIHPEDPSKGNTIVSVPWTNPFNRTAAQAIPQEGLDACRAFVRTILPPNSPLSAVAERPFAFTRLCHYAETSNGNFLVDYHPDYNSSLFLATGNSGHGFKFLPVIGEEIVNRLSHQARPAFEKKWAWPEAIHQMDKWTSDGSRAGPRGLILKEEMADPSVVKARL